MRVKQHTFFSNLQCIPFYTISDKYVNVNILEAKKVYRAEEFFITMNY